MLWKIKIFLIPIHRYCFQSHIVGTINLLVQRIFLFCFTAVPVLMCLNIQKIKLIKWTTFIQMCALLVSVCTGRYGTVYSTVLYVLYYRHTVHSTEHRVTLCCAIYNIWTAVWKQKYSTIMNPNILVKFIQLQSWRIKQYFLYSLSVVIQIL